MLEIVFAVLKFEFFQQLLHILLVSYESAASAWVAAGLNDFRLEGKVLDLCLVSEGLI